VDDGCDIMDEVDVLEQSAKGPNWAVRETTTLLLMMAPERGVPPGPAWVLGPDGLQAPGEAHIAASDLLAVARTVQALAASAWGPDSQSLGDALRARVLAAFLSGAEGYAALHLGHVCLFDYQMD